MTSSQNGVDEKELLDALFEGVVEPASLERALRMSMEALGAGGVNLHAIRKSSLETLFFTGFGDGYTDESISAYLDHWQYINAHRDAMRRLYSNDPLAVFLCHEHIDEEDWERGAYFQEFFSGINQRWLAGGVVWSGRSMEVSIAFSRTRKAGAFGEHERRFLELLIPNVRRATRLAGKLTTPRMGHPCSGFGGGLSSARMPSFLVDSEKNLQWMNAAGESYLAESQTICIEDGRLRANPECAEWKFRDYVKAAIGQDLAAATPNLLRIDDDTATSELEILPATVPSDALIGVSSLALVMVRTIGLDQSVCAKLKSYFKLTDAECALALTLANGGSIEEAAKERGSSQHTVRAQLRSVFVKTGVNRQSALAALVWKSV